uniref:Neural cell adhesion molecule 3 n=1 Tax=Cyprinus carpio TaxID=7962 RepID=A0A8C1QW15_CYPCA
MTASMMMLRLCGLLLMCSTLIDAKLDIISGDTDVQVGHDTLLLCKADSEGDFRWLKGDEDIDEDRYVVEKFDESTSKLLLNKVEVDDSGNYTCVFDSDRGIEKTSYQIYVYQTPDFGNTPLYHEFLVNRTVNIPCVVSGQPAVEIDWFRNNRTVKDDGQGHFRIQPDNSLQILGIQQEDSGTYTCEGRIKGRPITRTLKISVVVNGEPDSPILSLSEKKLDKNSVSIPIKQLKDGGSPILRYIVRYKGNKENEEWTEKEFPGNSSKIQLNNLQYDADYQMEVYAVNHNGSSSSAKINFTVPQPVSQPALGKGGVVGIVMFIFLILMVSVDAFCCYTNHCGLLNFLARKLFGHNISESKGMDEEANNSSG